MRMRLELVDVYCTKGLGTEDVTGGDEFYIAGTVISDSNGAKGVLTTPVKINNGQRMGFPEVQMYDGDDPENAMLAVYLRAYDEDVAHDWGKRPDYVDKIAAGVATAAGGLIVGGLAVGAISWTLIASGLGVGLGLGGFYLALSGDSDDQLGEYHSLIPVSGPSEELIGWPMKHDGGWTGYSGWEYYVQFLVRRG
jgi:hypothetical protein